MATITKKAAKRINELLADARLYDTLGNMSAGDGTGDYYRHAYREGVAVRALFDEFGIEGDGLSYFTEDKLEELDEKAFLARQARMDAELKARIDAEYDALPTH
tara:strand:- start:578 stop:889 length:312 start_codon:yes stop_codon:yes gene_type:complete